MSEVAIREALEIARAVRSFPEAIDPRMICGDLGIEVISHARLNKDGYLICDKGLKLIFVNGGIYSRHRRKFIVAHELGHFLMHSRKLFSCNNISELENQRINSDFQEVEANSFASELLLPREKVENHLPISRITFSCISDIADRYDVSMTFAAMQAVRFSHSENEILLCYENGKLRWYVAGGGRRLPQYADYRICPIELSAERGIADISGVWEELYNGSVHQEIFHPYGKTYLVLLFGDRL